MSRGWHNAGGTAAWRKVRLYVLQRDGYRCRLALPGGWTNSRGKQVRCLGRADSAHHTRSRALIGDDPQYLIAACTPCNLKVGNPEHYNPPHKVMTQW